MIRILLCGCCGRMGKTVAAAVKERRNCEIVAGVDIRDDSTLGYPVFGNFSEVNVTADVVMDFSNPALLPATLSYASQKKLPAVIATTGLSEEDIRLVHETAKTVPVFFTYNMSVGVSLLCELSKTAARVLGEGFDIEIVEAHHNQKVDAPSGTALMLADGIREALADDAYYYEYCRHDKREKRKEKEIGIHSVRGGNIVGEHEVIFAGTDEIIKLSHSARSKAVFATGALNAAVYLCAKKPGLYGMKDLIENN